MLFRANKKWALAHSSLPSNHRCAHGILLRRNKIVCKSDNTTIFPGIQRRWRLGRGNWGIITGKQAEDGRVRENLNLRPADGSALGQAQRLHSWRLIDLFRDATSPMLVRATIATAIAWVPLAILSAFQGMPAFLSFLTDYTALSRFLIIIPLLILGERPLQARYSLVANHFE